MSIANAVIQGVTAQVSLRALDRSINELDAARRRFSLLHDLGHHILAEHGRIAWARIPAPRPGADG